MSEVVELDSCAVKLVDPGKVQRARGAMPADTAIVGLADVFRLLGDTGRLRLLTALLQAGELCVCDLAATASMGESAVSHALRLLRAHGVVEVTRRGRMAYYRLTDNPVRALLDLGLAHHGRVTSPEVENRSG